MFEDISGLTWLWCRNISQLSRVLPVPSRLGACYEGVPMYRRVAVSTYRYFGNILNEKIGTNEYGHRIPVVRGTVISTRRFKDLSMTPNGTMTTIR